MKKYLFLSLLSLFLVGGVANASLWTFYSGNIPLLSDRGAETCGIKNYIGTSDQNAQLENCLKSIKLGDVMLGAPTVTYQRSVYPEVDNTYELGTSTNAWKNIVSYNMSIKGLATSTSSLCVSTDASGTLKLVACSSGGGGSGQGVVGTSTINYFAVYQGATSTTGTANLINSATGITFTNATGTNFSAGLTNITGGLTFTTANGTSITSTNASFTTLAATGSTLTSVTSTNISLTGVAANSVCVVGASGNLGGNSTTLSVVGGFIGIASSTPTTGLEVNTSSRFWTQNGSTSITIRGGTSQGANQMITMLNSAGGALGFVDASGVWRGNFSGTSNNVSVNDNGILIGNASILWSGALNNSGAGKDTGISRVSAGRIEVNDGNSFGAFMDFSARNFGAGIYSATTGTNAARILAKGVGTTSSSTLLLLDSSSRKIFNVFDNGHVSSSSTQPTLSSCGTSPVERGTDRAGEVTVGAVATSCTLTFAAVYTNSPSCVVTFQSSLAAETYSYTSTTLTIGATALGGTIVNYSCYGIAE